MQASQKTELVRVMPSAAENVKEIGTLIDLGVKCLEGTTERSDGNRVRSARIGEARTRCLEGTTPQDLHYKQRHRRTAFQAELLQQFLPGTSYPVTIATLCSAFQALNA